MWRFAPRLPEIRPQSYEAPIHVVAVCEEVRAFEERSSSAAPWDSRHRPWGSDICD